jgi:8-amino-7-oxononanoate synthase
VLTSSGSNADLALLSTVCGPDDALLVDAHAHASVHGGAAASAGAAIRFRHNDVGSLAAQFERLDPQAAAVVVVDGVYSMSGATAAGRARPRGPRRRGAQRRPAPRRRGHAGLQQEPGQHRRGDPDQPRGRRRHPRLCAALRLQRRLLTEAGVPPLPGSGAVVAVPTGSEEATAAAWRAAFDAGVSVNAVAYPAVAHGKGVLRLSVTATHTAEQLRTAAEVVADAVAGGTAQLAA